MMDALGENVVENMEELDEQGEKVQTEAYKRFKKIIVEKKLEESFSAETNREFIFTAFLHLREAFSKDLNVPLHGLEVNANSVQNIPTRLKGLYLIYECFAGDKIPIYLGYTGGSFRTRFLSHMRCGVLKYIFQKRREVELKVDLVPTLYPAHAKLLESVFLLSFDFKLNKVENQQTRPITVIDVPIASDIHLSRLYFDIAYKVLLKEINDVHEHYLQNIGLTP